MDKTRRQLYSLILKSMALMALLVLAWVLIRSVWPEPNPVSTENPSTADTFKLTGRAGQTQLIRWQGQEVSVLYRTPEMLASLPNTQTVVDQPTLKPHLRSIQPEYFVYLNRGAGIGCPISLIGTLGKQVLRDACTNQTYDLAGRPMATALKVPELTLPPHFLTADGQITLGRWQ